MFDSEMVRESIPGSWEDPSSNPWTRSRSGELPEGFDELPAGPELGALVSGMDRSVLSGYDLIRLIQAASRVTSHFQALIYEAMAEVVDLPEIDAENAASEIAAALCLTRTAGDTEYDLVVGLTRFPAILEALRRGAIDLRRVRVLISGLTAVDDQTASEVVDRILTEASELTGGQIHARLRRLVIETSPEKAKATYEQALVERRVVVDANHDGTANLHAYNLSPDRLNAIRARIEQCAHNARTPGDKRSADQLRADTFLDLLDGSVNGPSHKSFVNIDVDLTTLMGLDDKPGSIPGWGPITADLARQIVNQQHDTTWEYTITDQGQPVATGTVRRRPTTGMKRRIRSRYPTCVHPGCRRPARQADIDHTQPWSKGGSTTLGNLAPLCDYHHGLRDHGWKYQHQTDGGFKFTSPLGHTYLTNGQSP